MGEWFLDTVTSMTQRGKEKAFKGNGGFHSGCPSGLSFPDLQGSIISRFPHMDHKGDGEEVLKEQLDQRRPEEVGDLWRNLRLDWVRNWDQSCQTAVLLSRLNHRGKGVHQNHTEPLCWACLWFRIPKTNTIIECLFSKVLVYFMIMVKVSRRPHQKDPILFLVFLRAQLL